MDKEQTDRIINLLDSISLMSHEIRGIIRADAREALMETRITGADIAKTVQEIPYRAGKASFSRETEQLVRLHSEGKGNVEISQALQIHRDTVRTWLLKLGLTPNKLPPVYRPRQVNKAAKQRKRQLKKGGKDNA
jgi:DNA-binding NarL/FixJ family response regulator